MPIHNEKQRLNVTADEPISVTVDASDLSVASAEPLRNIMSRYGRPVVARAFADFQQPYASELAVQLYQMGFTLVHCPTWPNGDGVPKTVVSDVMAQDLRDQLEELEESVETYIVVATSREFIAVANALRRHDRRVVVVAEEAKVCRELRMCADEFAILPHTRTERASEVGRQSRAAEIPRSERLVELGRGERLPEPVRLPSEPVRVEKPAVPVRLNRTAEPAAPARPEKTSGPHRTEKPVEVVRAEAARVERADSQDMLRLPTDAEVLVEVRRIVAAEGICTPRRLARALCPVDRTATGEGRSRIANRIQALVDVGKLQRERLVVGGTSVETILAREDQNGRTAEEHGADAPAKTVPAAPLAVTFEPEGDGQPEIVAGEAMIQGEAVAQPEIVAEEPVAPSKPRREKRAATSKRQENGAKRSGQDLDALVESVLRSPELAVGLLGRESEPAHEVAEAPAEVPDATKELTKRSRSRRRAPAKAAVAAAEPNGAV